MSGSTRTCRSLFVSRPSGCKTGKTDATHQLQEVAGLKAETKIKVLFEDRALISADGHFTDDFRGQDLYQRFGGGLPGGGYGNTPVSLHIYEIP